MTDEATMPASVSSASSRSLARPFRPVEERARSYVRRARRVAERHRLRLPRSFERSTCDACDTYLLHGHNARSRTQAGHVVIACDCGSQSRYPYD